MSKQYSVFQLSQCPDCNEEGDLNGFDCIYTDSTPIASFTYPADAIEFAKIKGEDSQ